MSALFQIRCLKCRWAKMSNGTQDDLKDLYESQDDLKDLYELKNSCSTCGKKRKFRCPKCGQAATMHRVDQSGGFTSTTE